MRKSAKEVLCYLIELLQRDLSELNGTEGDDFYYGEKTAFVECLEIIQQWKHARKAGLNYEIEKRFPL